MSKLILIDGNSLFHRAYHALPTTLTNYLREPVNAVYGFSNMLLKTVLELKPTHMAVAFDTLAPTFRHIEFETYKATRPEPPADLYPQLPKVKEVLQAFGVPIFEVDGYEADDILATIASRVVNSSRLTVDSKKSKKSMNRGPSTVNQVIILSGDRDCLQLVNKNVKVQMPGWNLKETTLYGAEEIRKKYGIGPDQMVDFKALTGDPSDNIPGVSGIGPKTAADLLQKFSNIEEIYKNLDEIPENLREKLVAGKEDAFQARSLVTLDQQAPIEKFKIENLELKINWDKVKAEFEKLRFKSLVARVPIEQEKKRLRDKEEGAAEADSKTTRDNDFRLI